MRERKHGPKCLDISTVGEWILVKHQSREPRLQSIREPLCVRKAQNGLLGTIANSPFGQISGWILGQ